MRRLFGLLLYSRCYGIVLMCHNVFWLGEVPPCRMLKVSTKACGGILPNRCYKPFFIRVWRNI